MKKESIFQKVDLTALEQTFMKACSDTEFKQYIYKTGAPDETLMKYTSSLQESFGEYQNCLKCKGFYECKNQVKGYYYQPSYNKKNVISFSYKVCQYKKEIDVENSYKQNVMYFEMSEDNQNASLKDVYKDDKARVPIIKYFKEFSSQLLNGEKPKGMYLYGSFGSGKTYLISALFNELAKKNIKSALIHYPMFLKKLKSSFDDYDDIMDSVMKVPLLLIDDIGSEKETDWSRDEVLMSILQYRMDNHLATFFTTNLTLEDLEKNLSITSSGIDKIKARRIMERIKQLTVYYELISKNRRV